MVSLDTRLKFSWSTHVGVWSSVFSLSLGKQLVFKTYRWIYIRVYVSSIENSRVVLKKDVRKVGNYWMSYWLFKVIMKSGTTCGTAVKHDTMRQSSVRRFPVQVRRPPWVHQTQACPWSWLAEGRGGSQYQDPVEGMCSLSFSLMEVRNKLKSSWTHQYKFCQILALWS